MSKISDLPSGGSLQATDYLIAVRSGSSVKVQPDSINFSQVDLADSAVLQFGDSQDLTIVHNTFNSVINQAGTGNLLIQKAGTTKASITANGLEFPDNSKAIFGADSDLSLYHVGGNSYVLSNTGSLILRSDSFRVLNTANSEQILHGDANGAVTAYYDNAVKLATTATGIDVTGTATIDGIYNNGIYNQSSGDIQFWVPNVGEAVRIQQNTGNVGIGTSSPSAKLHLKASNNAYSGGFRIEGTDETTALAITHVNGDNFFSGNGTDDHLVLTGAGNVGIGSTAGLSGPSAATTLRIGNQINLYEYDDSSNPVQLNLNQNIDSNENYIATDQAARYQMRDGVHSWFSVASGTAGTSTNIGANEKMRIDASGDIRLTGTAPNAEDAISAINFFNSSSGTNLASIIGKRTAGGNNYGSLIFNTTDVGTAAERMRIASNGNVGIGVVPSASSATTNIELPYGATLSSRSNTTAPQFAMMSNAVGNWYEPTYKIDGFATQYVQQGNDGTHVWSTAASGTAGNNIAWSESMRIDASGNLLIGLSSIGATPDQGFGVAISGSGANGNIKTVGNGSHTHFIVVNASNVVGSITSNSSSTAYNTSSDRRLKENIADADDAGAKIDSIRVRKYDWKVDGSHQDYGMVAQELLEVAPEAVSASEDPEEMMGVDYSKLVPMMLKEIQSLRARVAQLES